MQTATAVKPAKPIVNRTYTREPDWDIFVVKLYAQADGEYKQTRILGVFDSKEKAADYIFRVTGMHINNDWSVIFIEPLMGNHANGDWAEMYIECYKLNEPDDGYPDWTDVQDVFELME